MILRTATCAAAIALGALAAGGPAGATIVDRGHTSDAYSFAFADCGFEIEINGSVSTRYRIREGSRADESAYFLHETFSFRETLTNPVTGEWVLLRGSGTANDVKATRLEGSLFEVKSIVAGQPFVLEDSDGNVVLRDRGVIRRWILFDTGGDDDPASTELALLDIEVGGPHPALFVDFCDIARDLIGPTAAGP